MSYPGRAWSSIAAPHTGERSPWQPRGPRSDMSRGCSGDAGGHSAKGKVTGKMVRMTQAQ